MEKAEQRGAPTVATAKTRILRKSKRITVQRDRKKAERKRGTPSPPGGGGSGEEAYWRLLYQGSRGS